MIAFWWVSISLSLFRPQVLARRFRAPLAEPLQLPSCRLRGVALTLLLGSVLGLVGLLQSSYASKVSVTGYTEPASGVTKVFANQLGVVTQVHVAEGDWVAAGASLMTLSLQSHLEADQPVGDLQIQQLEDQLSELSRRQRLQVQQQAAVDERVRQEQAQRDAMLPLLAAERGSHARRQQLQSERVAALQKLAGQGLIPKLELAQAEADLLAMDLAAAGLARQHLQITQRLGEQRATALEQRTQLQLNASRQRSEALGLQQQLVRVRAARSTQVLAPLAGQVSFLQAYVGKRVNPRQALLNLVDTSSSQSVVLLLPSRAASQVAVGQRVSWRYQGLSPEKSKLMWGQVLQVSSTPVAPADLDVLVPLSEPAYRARLQMDAALTKPQDLVPGLLVEADIRLRQARLWRWLLDPLLTAWRRL